MGYKILKLHSDEDWLKLRTECTHLTEWGLGVLQNGLKHVSKWVIIEPDYICKDHSNLYSNFYSKRFAPVERHTFRLHFFSESYETLAQWMAKESNEIEKNYIGYAVIRDSSERCLGRCIFDPSKILGTGAYVLRAPYAANLFGKRLTIKGFPFMSQDRDITVCAHSTLWAICRFLSQKFRSYGEYLPFDIVQSVNQMSGRIYPYRGMTYSDYSQILSDFGVYPLVEKMYRTDAKGELVSLKKEEQLYTYLESGFPIIASYGNHVAAIVGHTIKKAPPKQTSDFMSTSEMVDKYYVVDDNRFPYLELRPPHYKYAIKDIKTMVIPLPEKVFLTADKIITLVDKYLNSKSFLPALKAKVQGPFLKRIFVATSISYKRGLHAHFRSTGSKASAKLLTQKLPHFLWVVEVMNHGAYGRKMANAVFLLDPTAEPTKSIDKVILFRDLAGSYTLPDSSGTPRLAQDTVQEMPMFIHNLS